LVEVAANSPEPRDDIVTNSILTDEGKL